GAAASSVTGNEEAAAGGVFGAASETAPMAGNFGAFFTGAGGVGKSVANGASGIGVFALMTTGCVVFTDGGVGSIGFGGAGFSIGAGAAVTSTGFGTVVVSAGVDLFAAGDSIGGVLISGAGWLAGLLDSAINSRGLAGSFFVFLPVAAGDAGDELTAGLFVSVKIAGGDVDSAGALIGLIVVLSAVALAVSALLTGSDFAASDFSTGAGAEGTDFSLSFVSAFAIPVGALCFTGSAAFA